MERLHLPKLPNNSKDKAYRAYKYGKQKTQSNEMAQADKAALLEKYCAMVEKGQRLFEEQ